MGLHRNGTPPPYYTDLGIAVLPREEKSIKLFRPIILLFSYFYSKKLIIFLKSKSTETDVGKK